jgi:transcriptional regulator with XRE-family HTH domain
MPTDHEPTPLARHIRQAREAAGMSQFELAVASKVTSTTISRIECDATKPLLPTLEKLAHGLGVELGTLFNGDGST